MKVGHRQHLNKLSTEEHIAYQKFRNAIWLIFRVVYGIVHKFGRITVSSTRETLTTGLDRFAGSEGLYKLFTEAPSFLLEGNSCFTTGKNRTIRSHLDN
jgi:hypothetical protein